MAFEISPERLMEWNVGQLVHLLRPTYDEEVEEKKMKTIDKAFKRIFELAKRSEVKRREGSSPGEEDIGAYQLSKGPGCVLMMSNSFEGKGDMSRVKESSKDLWMMAALWNRIGNCEFFRIGDNEELKNESKKVFESYVETQIEGKGVYENLDAAKMEYLLEKLSETKKPYSYIVVYISSHGARISEDRINELMDKGKTSPTESKAASVLQDFAKSLAEPQEVGSDAQVFLGNDGIPVREDRILELFHNHKNEKIDGIPKFFILDYCRSMPQHRRQSKTVEEQPVERNSEVSVTASLPLMSDIVVMNATHDFYLAFDDPEGSKLTKWIYHVFKENYDKREMLDMLTMVNAEMKGECKAYQAMSVFQSSLDRKFYLCTQGVWMKAAPTPSKRLKKSM